MCIFKKATSKEMDFICCIGNDDLLSWVWHLEGSSSGANKFHPEVSEVDSPQGAVSVAQDIHYMANRE